MLLLLTIMQVTGNKMQDTQDNNRFKRISIQVSLSGYSFKVSDDAGAVKSSGWLTPDKVFTTEEFRRRYESVEISLLSSKCALVPVLFFDSNSEREALMDVVSINADDEVRHIDIPEKAAVLVYSNSMGETLSTVISGMVLLTNGNSVPVLPELYFLIKDIDKCQDYNKIFASYMDGFLHLVVAQGKTLLLANIFQAQDFTTAEYFIFLALKKLQLNPEVSTIVFRTPVSYDNEMSLYRYFRSVEVV